MTGRNPFRTRLVTSLVAAPLALGLVACGSEDDDDNVTAPVASAPASASASASGDDTAVLAAAETALGAASGSTIFSIDRSDDGGWEVSLVAADGSESDVDVSADGSSITRGPVADDDGDDGDDAAERDRLLGADIDHATAIEAARSSATGTVTGVDLDEDNGTATWDVELDGDTATAQTVVVVDAASGEVLRTETDD